MRWLSALLVILALCGPARAEEVVAGLSQARVSITTDFDGSEILIFGAVKREAPISQEAPLHVIITVSGPDLPVTIRKKGREYGIWVNNEVAHVPTAPSFYAIATTGPLDGILTPEENSAYRVSIPRSIRRTGVFMQVENAAEFIEALIRIRTDNGLYQLREGAVTFQQSTLFRASIKLPANLTEGDYSARIFLTREGKVVDVYETEIGVRKVGLERWLYNLAHDLPFVYGLLSLFIAITAGWGASAVFRLIRG